VREKRFEKEIKRQPLTHNTDSRRLEGDHHTQQRRHKQRRRTYTHIHGGKLSLLVWLLVVLFGGCCCSTTREHENQASRFSASRRKCRLSSGQRPKHTAYASPCMFSRLERVFVGCFWVCQRTYVWYGTDTRVKDNLVIL